jgi:hypothetical protein
MTNIELYFNMNEQRISTNQLKILLALQHISEDAQQWKENEKMDLDDSTNVDKQWNDWTGFKTRFLKNWEELDSPGNAFSELLSRGQSKSIYSESSSRTGGDNAYRGQRSCGTVPEVTQGTRALRSIVYTI